jgi:hypothetical protein
MKKPKMLLKKLQRRGIKNSKCASGKEDRGLVSRRSKSWAARSFDQSMGRKREKTENSQRHEI